jgi:hypothetical protein
MSNFAHTNRTRQRKALAVVTRSAWPISSLERRVRIEPSAAARPSGQGLEPGRVFSRGFFVAAAAVIVIVGLCPRLSAAAAAERELTLSWEKEILSVHGKNVPGGVLEIWYIEAFCRPGSTNRDWSKTVIRHKTELLSRSPDGRSIKLRSRLDDGVVVDHEIRAGGDEVDFQVVARNPTAAKSAAHWAQPCIRVNRYAGTKLEHNSEAYLPHCFIYVDGKPVRMPVDPWAKRAIYTPGQVWCPSGVSRDDVNPRPLSSIVPSNGLIGCVSADGKELVAAAWEPYQELFQGVIVCVHSDFRIGGLEPGQSKTIRGKIYLMPADFPALESRYRHDFPGQERQIQSGGAGAGSSSGGAGSHGKKLIEFGWDEPDTAFLRRRGDQLEAAPFDGCVFHAVARGGSGKVESFTWLGWGRRAFAREDLKSAFDDLASLRWSRPRHDFLRFNVTPADLDWFDDHAAAIANAKLAALLARAGRCEGILLDTEAYQGKLFDFSKQRDASGRGWREYALMAGRRGRELMAAFQEGFSGLTVLCTFGHSLVWRQSDAGKKPLADCRDGLLVPFLDGMIEAAKAPSRLIDGHEMSYGYVDADAFVRARQTITADAAGLSADRSRYGQFVSPGFGIWLDYDWQKKGWKPKDPESNHFSPERLESSLRAAIEQSGEYVWIYTEKPRWWSENGPVDLPASYVETVRRVRRALGGG